MKAIQSTESFLAPPAIPLPRRAPLAKRVGLGSLMVLVSLNIWTGSPALALWIASRLQGGQQLKMSGVFLVILIFGALSLSLIRLLAVLGAAYEAATGETQTVRRHVPWLRSMRGERRQYPGTKPRVTMLERILIVMAVAAIALLEIWFFFFSGSPIDQRSGRADATQAVTALRLAPDATQAVTALRLAR